MRNLRMSVVAAAILAAATGAQAAPVPSSVGTSAGINYATAAMSSFTTTGAEMAGMVVTVNFNDGSSDSAIWAITGGNSGAAQGGGWAMGLDGDSFTAPWTLVNGARPIIGFSIDGAPGSTSFDILATPVGTPGSAAGKAFGSADSSDAAVTFASATYSNRLFVGGIFFEDQYVKLSVRLRGELGVDQNLTFIADTDNAMSRGDITPGVPEPETYARMLAGLGVVGYAARRRRST